jgi:Ca2+-dependent lipid-binding protein
MILQIKFVEAKGLAKMDLIGKSDPYCTLRMNSSKKFKKSKLLGILSHQNGIKIL